MKVLLDTNIFIYRESHNAATDTVAMLFNWFDKLNYKKLLTPLTREEIEGYSSSSENDKRIKKTLLTKIASYTEIIPQKPDQEFLSNIKSKFTSESRNNLYDNHILYQAFKGTAGTDVLLTNDQGLLRKAEHIGIRNRVLSPVELLTKIEKENPEKVDYKMLAIEKTKFGFLNFDDVFFDSLKADYEGIEKWFIRKNLEDCYILRGNNSSLEGFLYIKPEDLDEPYNIKPSFSPKKRLKIGTFKINSTGFRAGERFLKIIFENAKILNVDEIYVTMFDKRNDLKDFFAKWGFKLWGRKADTDEIVLVKEMKEYNTSLSPQKNFPILEDSPNYFILPIEPQYHTDLFPDSILKNESEHLYNENFAHRYALSKVYITGAGYRTKSVKPGDVFLIYRKGERLPKKYSSCVTTLCVLDKIISPTTEEGFLRECENRTIFSEQELRGFWNSGRYRTIVKLVEFKNLENKIILEKLLEVGLTYDDLRPFSPITKLQFEEILELNI